ncbi:uncharacterized protein LODBEIA_P48520 [Lodderomyces beijingensis]|uniref:C2H2-type domain-containing protein n=1 Tax=Lodderomyces beijingensis TaxID=1775926 RepID=A0ABP0ZR36_9ASCO
MDKFLLSSPTQLAQPYNYDESSILNSNSIGRNPPFDMFDNSNSAASTSANPLVVPHQHSYQQQHQQQQQPPPQQQSRSNTPNSHSHNHFQQFPQQNEQSQPLLAQFHTTAASGTNKHSTYNSLNETTIYENEVVPVSTNLPDNKFYITDENGLGINVIDSDKVDFANHSRNTSIDDNLPTFNMPNNYQIHHHQHQDSVISVNQDPPTSNSNSHIPHSVSLNTLYSFESGHSFDSPMHQHQQQQPPPPPPPPPQQQQQSQNGHNYQSQSQQFASTPRRIGRNSASLSLYNTPLKTDSFSPINLATTSSAFANKITKTPANKSLKGHSRSRSKVSLDAAAAALASKTNSSSSYNSTLNPFYTPSQATTSFDDDSNCGGGCVSGAGRFGDVTATPLKSPNSNQIKHSQSTFFSPFGNDALDSLNDDDEDDAVKQLKKAKSFSSLKRKQRRESQIRPLGLNNSLNENTLSSSAIISTKSERQLALPRSHKIDLLSPDFDRTPDDYPALDKKITSNLNLSVSPYNPHRKNIVNIEFPSASMNLNASINLARSEDEDYSSTMVSPPTTNTATPNLLPPMATFSNDLLKNAAKKSTLNEQHGESDKAEKSLAYSSCSSRTGGKTSKSPFSSSSSSNNSINSLKEEIDEDGTVTIPIPSDLLVTRPTVRNNRSDKNDKVDPKKKHKCPICDSRFQRPEHVKRHLKSHSSEKPYHCEEPDCGKQFNRKDNLKAHLKKIHGIMQS